MKQSRANYAATFGPTTGDRVRLVDAELFIEVERDLIAENGGYGNEVKFGGGKVIRDGMAQSPLACDAEVPDLVIWKTAFFGVKPETILKGGLIAWANMGDPNASIPTPQPTFYRPQFGSFGKAVSSTSVTFVSAAALESGGLEKLNLTKRLVAVKNCRTVTKKDLPFNDALPVITVDPETYTVTADGRELRCEPLSTLPMAQRYFLF